MLAIAAGTGRHRQAANRGRHTRTERHRIPRASTVQRVTTPTRGHDTTSTAARRDCPAAAGRQQPHQPWGNITALLHYSTEGKPEAIEHREVVGEGRSVDAVLDLPLVRAEAAHDEQDDGDAGIGEDHIHPDLGRQRVHEREHPRLLLLRLLDHDADAETHERLREVDASLAVVRRRQWRHRKVGFLRGQGQSAMSQHLLSFIYVSNYIYSG